MMKGLVTWCFLIVGANALTDYEIWNEFKAKYSKKYDQYVEEQHRFQVFRDNLLKIEKHNAKYDSGEVSYFLKINNLADKTEEEFKAMLNHNLSNKMATTTRTSEFIPNFDEDIPETVDWRETAVVSIKEQGVCASCWSFGATGALEGQLALKKNLKIELSEQELIDCSSRYGNQGCMGGFASLAYEYVKDHGISSEESYPYTFLEGTCGNGSKVIDSISGYKQVPANEDALKVAIATVGPISIAVDSAHIEWQLYGGGIFDISTCIPNKMNHQVLAVGYGIENSTPYWLIKNCWSTTWGEGGYMRMVRGKNMCGVANAGDFPEL